MLYHEETDGFAVKDDLVSKTQSQLLKIQAQGVMFKFCLMIILAGKSFPELFDDASIKNDFTEPYNRHAIYKVKRIIESESIRIQEARDQRLLSKKSSKLTK